MYRNLLFFGVVVLIALLEASTAARVAAQGKEPITPANANRVTQLVVLKYGDSQEGVHSVAFSPDGTILAAGSGNGWGEPGSVYLWDVAMQTERAVLRGHTAWVRSVAFSPDGKLLASGSGDRTVRLWDIATGKTQRMFQGLGDAVSGTVTITAEDGSMRSLEVFSDAVWSVAFSPDGTTLATGRGDPMGMPGSFQLYDVSTGKLLVDFRPRHANVPSETCGVSSLAFSPDGTLLATANRDCTVRLWKVATAQERTVLRACSSWVVFSPDGAKVAAASRIWDVATGKLLTVPEGNIDIQSAAFSPDGRIVASGSDDGSVRLWDARIGTSLAVLKGHAGSVSSVVFNADGTILATGGWDGTVRLWGVPVAK